MTLKLNKSDTTRKRYIDRSITGTPVKDEDADFIARSILAGIIFRKSALVIHEGPPNADCRQTAITDEAPIAWALKLIQVAIGNGWPMVAIRESRTPDDPFVGWTVSARGKFHQISDKQANMNHKQNEHENGKGNVNV